MDFGLSDDQSMFQQSLRGFLAERVPTERVRAVMESASGHDAALIRQLADQGVTGILIPEEYGGTGLGLLDAALAAEELGRAAAPFSFHTAAVLAPLLLAASASDKAKSEWLPRIAEGKSLVSVILGAPRVNGGRLRGSSMFVADANVADAFVVVCGDESSPEFHLIARGATGLRVEPLATVDDTRRVGEVFFEDVAVDASTRLEITDGAAMLARAIDAARVALAADALGAAERSLEEAVKYALTREQFGRVIGSFQAVKHMCAEVFAEVEPVRSLLWYAAFAWDEQKEDARAFAALLKSHATEVATEATTTCVQVYGGMGFTYECDMQLWFKRAGYDRQMFGSPTRLREIAADLMTAA
ncbi:MAG TPA: acyl-CoA dehydrogenase family protein [Candidatus Limnocylindrales bacterium]|nr:acyl-CoA dehydrogenase family protein [Candidatus Limnocylindrales bacterium]